MPNETPLLIEQLDPPSQAVAWTLANFIAVAEIGRDQVPGLLARWIRAQHADFRINDPQRDPRDQAVYLGAIARTLSGVAACGMRSRSSDDRLSIPAAHAGRCAPMVRQRSRRGVGPSTPPACGMRLDMGNPDQPCARDARLHAWSIP